MSDTLKKYKEAAFAKTQAGDSSQGDGSKGPGDAKSGAARRGAGQKKPPSNSRKAALLEAGRKDAEAAKTAAGKKQGKAQRPPSKSGGHASAADGKPAIKKPTIPPGAALDASHTQALQVSAAARLDDGSAPKSLTLWHRSIVKEIVRDSDAPLSYDEVLEQLLERDEKVSSQFSQSIVKEALHSLAEGGIVVYQDGKYSYRSMDGIVNKDALLQHLRRRPHGTVLQHIQDEYKGLLADVERLREEGKVYKIHHTEQKYDVLFAANKTGLPDVRVDRDLVEFWHEVEVLEPIKRQEALLKAGLKCFSSVQTEKREPLAVVQKPKKKRQYRPRNVTNTHLLGTDLFKGEQPSQID